MMQRHRILQLPYILSLHQYEGIFYKMKFKKYGPFDSFLRCSTQKKNLTALLRNIICGSTESRHIHLVDVGCGEGTLTIPLCKEIQASGIEVRLTALDSSEDMLAMIEHRLETSSIGYECLHTDFNEKNHLRLLSSLPNVVLYSHVLYYANDLDRVLKEAIQALQGQGICVLSHQSNRSPMHKLRSELAHQSVDGELIAGRLTSVVETDFAMSVRRLHSELQFPSGYDEILHNFSQSIPSPQGSFNLQETKSILQFISRDGTDSTQRLKAVANATIKLLNKNGVLPIVDLVTSIETDIH